MEEGVAVGLQRRLGPADGVELGELAHDVALGAIGPHADLVLLAVEVLFAAWLGGQVFAELVGGAVDAVAGGERGGEDQALHEGWAASVLE